MASSEFSTKLRATEAVPSGFNVIERPPLSSNVYISLFTTSVPSPMPRTNSSVCSNMGVRISRTLYSDDRRRRLSSIYRHLVLSDGSVSFVPLGMLIISIVR